jgi:cellulose synthase/poly-beta-1,6-N-acetylglucosamine synthase-like glycosyltransferase
LAGRPAVPAGAEFRSIKRALPMGLVKCLIVLTIAYGVWLTLTLPFNLPGGILQESWLGAAGTVGSILSDAWLVLTMVRWSLVNPLAMLGFWKELGSFSDTVGDQPLVSILVPACNEAETIGAAIRSLIALDYPRYEIIVVDDGSRDETYAIAKPYEGEQGQCSIRVLAKPNGGKWSALNYAYANASGELLLCVDADSRLAPDTLRTAVARIQQDPGIMAVAGQVTIRNRTNLLMRLQALEYVLGNGGMRMAMSRLGLVSIVPGAIGLYRRSIFERIAALPRNRRPSDDHGEAAGKVFGPLSGETFAEDFQLSLSALALGGKVVYEPRAVAFTKGPSRVDTLLSQRYRWMRGTWQVVRVYFRDLRAHAARSNPRLRWVVATCYTVDIFLIPVVNFGFWAYLATQAAVGIDLTDIVTWLAAVALLNLMAATVYLLVHEDDLWLSPLSLLMDLYVSVVVNSAWAIAAVDEARGARMKWH